MVGGIRAALTYHIVRLNDRLAQFKHRVNATHIGMLFYSIVYLIGCVAPVQWSIYPKNA